MTTCTAMPESRLMLLLFKSQLQAMLPVGSEIVGVRYDLGTETLELFVRGLGPKWQEGQLPWCTEAKIVRSDGQEFPRA